MKGMYISISDYFLYDFISSTSDRFEKSRIRFIFWFFVILSLSVACYLPFLYQISPKLLIVGFSLFSLIIGSIAIMRYQHSYKFSCATMLLVLQTLVCTIQVLHLNSNIGIYLLNSLIVLSASTFILGIRWGIGFSIYTLLGVVLTTYFKTNGIEPGLFFGFEGLKDNSLINSWYPLEMLIPFTCLVVLMTQFIQSNFNINKILIKNVKIQKELNNKLEKEAKYRRLVETAGDLVYEIDKYGNLTFINPAFAEILGLTEEDILNQPFINIVHEECLRNYIHYYTNQEKNNLKQSYYQYRLKGKDDAVIWVGQKTNMTFDESNLLVNSFCIGRDITLLKDIHHDIIEARKETEKASLAKTQFLSSMSHEIRTPLNAIIASIHLLSKENLSKEQADHLETLRFSADNLYALVTNILDFSQFDYNKIDLHKSTFELKDSLLFIELGLQKNAIKKGLKFSVEIDEALPKKISGDTLRLTQLINNLADNAIKFTEKGEVKITAKQIEKNDDKVKIEFAVSDTGIGIAEDKMKIIFDEFVQANDDTIREGAGLGLTLSNKIAHLFNSKIELKSEVGKGSVFSCILEFDIVSSHSKLPSREGVAITTKIDLDNSLQGCNVLLVEDNLINQKVTSKFLKKWGMEVSIAENGKIALEKVLMNDFDVILMDLQMPVMNGIESTKAIRSMGGVYARIPILALTASAVTEIRQNAMSAGLTDFITKPFQPNHLNAKIMDYVQNSGISDELHATSRQNAR